MQNKKRRVIILIMTVVICVIALFIYNAYEEKHYQGAYFSYIEKGYEDTNATNLVAAIYLNYRVFDTIFETLLLAISVTAVVYFAKPWEKNKEEEEEDDE